MTTYVVGADGGNSKTDLVLADTDGRVLSRVRTGGVRPQSTGMPAAVQALADGVRAAVERAGLVAGTPVAAAVFCVANFDLVEAEDAARAELERLAVADRVLVHNDTFAVLRAGSTAGWGVAVVCGAGINALGVHPDGRTHRFLALGPETGDWGGGRSVALAGLGAAVRAGDGRGAGTTLRTLIPQALGRADAESVAVAVHGGELDADAVRSLAPVVLGAADRGDAVAAGIVTRLADEVVDFAVAALRRLDLLDARAEIVLGGGMLQSGNAILLDRIRKGTRGGAPNSAVTVLDVAPVAGALVDALEAVGAPAAARTWARAALRS